MWIDCLESRKCANSNSVSKNSYLQRQLLVTHGRDRVTLAVCGTSQCSTGSLQFWYFPPENTVFWVEIWGKYQGFLSITSPLWGVGDSSPCTLGWPSPGWEVCPRPTRSSCCVNLSCVTHRLQVGMGPPCVCPGLGNWCIQDGSYFCDLYPVRSGMTEA